MDKNSNYLKFIDKSLELAKAIPRYFSKYANKIFCNHQKIVLLVLKQKLRTTYRDLIEILKISHIPLYLGLKRIPHHTTLIKFAKKIKSSLLNNILSIRQACTVGIDATGFELENKSYYYRTIWNSNKPQKTKRFMKLTIAADANKQLILHYKIRRDYKRCNIEFRDILKELKVDYVVADKGYSSRENRNFVLYKLNAIPFIPYKKNEWTYKFRDGKRLRFDEKIYHQRSKVETIFSVIKRKYGSILKGRSFVAQNIELICKLIAYNTDRMINFYSLLLRVSAEPYFKTLLVSIYHKYKSNSAKFNFKVLASLFNKCSIFRYIFLVIVLGLLISLFLTNKSII